MNQNYLKYLIQHLINLNEIYQMTLFNIMTFIYLLWKLIGGEFCLFVLERIFVCKFRILEEDHYIFEVVDYVINKAN